MAEHHADPEAYEAEMTKMRREPWIMFTDCTDCGYGDDKVAKYEARYAIILALIMEYACGVEKVVVANYLAMKAKPLRPTMKSVLAQGRACTETKREWLMID